LFFGFGSGVLATVHALAAHLDHSAACPADQQPKQGILVKHCSNSLIAAVALATASFGAHAAKADDIAGPYIGASLGASYFDTQGVAALPVGSDKGGVAARVYGGYQLSENFGVQVGWTTLRRLEANYVGSVGTIKQTASGRSLYVAGTGRLPLGESFALTGKAGISFGKASGTNTLSAADSLIGSKRSLMVGFGGEYRLNRDIALTVDYERYGKLSNKLSAAALFAGARFSF
jgi:OmpA-OmpF porin, OOP family